MAEALKRRCGSQPPPPADFEGRGTRGIGNGLCTGRSPVQQPLGSSPPASWRMSRILAAGDTAERTSAPCSGVCPARARAKTAATSIPRDCLGLLTVLAARVLSSESHRYRTNLCLPSCAVNPRALPTPDGPDECTWWVGGSLEDGSWPAFAGREAGGMTTCCRQFAEEKTDLNSTQCQ